MTDRAKASCEPGDGEAHASGRRFRPSAGACLSHHRDGGFLELANLGLPEMCLGREVRNLRTALG